MALRGTGVGIDLGAHSIKVVDLRVSEKGALIRRALYFDRVSLLSQGVDPADRPRLAAFLKQQMVACGIPARDVVLGISGKDSIIRYTHVPPVPAWRLKIIMDYEVGEVAEKIGEKLIGDYRVLPVHRDADDDQAIIIGLAKESTLDGFLGDLAAAGITVAKAVPAPLALYAAYSAFGQKPDLENPEDELAAVIDLGAESLNMAFLLNGNLAFARSASFGGKTFTEALARDLGLDLENAEATKLKHGALEHRAGGTREELVNSLRGVAAQLLSMVQSTPKFSRSQTGVSIPEPTRYVLVGGGAALPGLVSYLQGGLRKPVEVFHPLVTPAADIAGSAGRILSSAPGNFAVALGLAVAGLRREGMELSLLPAKYVEKKNFRERTVYLYAAGALLVLFLTIQLVLGLSENRTVLHRKAELKGHLEYFQGKKAEMLENAAQNRLARERINRILREAEITPFQAFLLDFLSKRTGPELKVQALKLVSDAGEAPYVFQIDGAADNVSQKALARIEELRAAFSAESRIARVEVTSTSPEGNWYKFQMVLMPSYPAHR